MSLLSGIITGDCPVLAKQLAHLITLIKQLGWESLNDTRSIKPNLRRAQLYLRKNSHKLKELFNFDLGYIDKDEIFNLLNPYLIDLWHVRIIGGKKSASLQLLKRVENRLYPKRD